MEETKVIQEWKQELSQMHIPRWEELPDIDIYMDQLVSLVGRYTKLFRLEHLSVSKFITASMVNNYVKQKLIPPPHKKKYNQQHIAYLVVITILKQVFDIPAIKKGISWQMSITDSKNGYDQFCQQLEETTKQFALSDEEQPVHFKTKKMEQQPLQMATVTLLAKLMAEKTLEFLTDEEKKEQTHEEE